MSKSSWAAKVASASAPPPQTTAASTMDSEAATRTKDTTATKQQPINTKQPLKTITTPAPSLSSASSTSASSPPASSPSASPAMSPASVSASRNLLNYFLTNLRGHLVLVQVKDNTVYEGIFHTADIQASTNQSSSPDSVTLVIRLVQQQADSFTAQHASSPRLQHTVATAERNTLPFIAQRKFALSDIVQMRAVALDFNDTTEGKKAGGTGKKGLTTDKEISNRDFQERELTRWEAGSEPTSSGGGGLEDDTSVSGALSAASGRGWDQFTVHERMTGRHSTFDMDDYTTPLDKHSAHYRENLARAERIAREIERQGSGGNLHVALERGQVSNEEVDEERLFSSVLDEAKGSGNKSEKIEKSAQHRVSVDGKYVPPGRRREAGEAGGVVESRKAKGGEAKEEEKEKEKSVTESAPEKNKGVPESEKRAETRSDRASEQKVADGDAEVKPGKNVVVETEEKTKEEEKREGKPEKKYESATPTTKPISSPSTESLSTTHAVSAASADAVSKPSTASSTASTTAAASSSSSSAPSSTSSAASTDSSAASTAPTTSTTSNADKPKAKSTLNPKAKSFSLNAAAKEFVPSTTNPSTTPTTSHTQLQTPHSLPPTPLPANQLTQPPQPSLPMYGAQQLPAGMQQQPGGYGGMGMGMALMHPGVGVGGHMQFAGAMAAAGGPRLMTGGMLPPGGVQMVGGQQLQPAAYFAQQPYAMAPMQPQLLQPGLFPQQQQFGPFVPHQPGQSLPQLGGAAGRGGLNAAQQQQLAQHLMMAAAAQQQQQQQMHDPRFFNPQQQFQPQQGAFNQQRF